MVRSFVKEVNQSQNLNKWIQQKRIQETFERQIQNLEWYDWKSFWRNISAKGMTTFFKNNNRISFLLKLSHNELSTINRLEIRWPDLYKQNKSYLPCDKEKKSRKHLFEYKKLENKINQI